jgi:biotin carboxylase
VAVLHVLFVAPYLLENTLRTVRALVGVPGARVGLISADPTARLAAADPALHAAIAGHYRVDDPADPAQLTAAVRAFQAEWGRVDRLIGSLEQLQVPLGAARSACGVPGMPLDVARNFRDKDRMKDVLRAAGLPVARHAAARSADEVRAFAREVGLPVILKPVAGVGARHTVRVTDEAGLAAAIAAHAPSVDRPVQVEEFITGIERTFEAVLIDGQPVWWSGSRYHPTPLQVLEHPWMQYTVTLPREPEPAHTRFAPVGVAAVQALGLRTGLCHMEWFERADGSFVIGEVGARPPGVNLMPLMSAVHDADMVARWCHLMVHGEFQPLRRVRAAGTAFFRGQGQGKRVVAVHGLDAAQKAVGQLVIDRRLPVIGQPAHEGYEGEGWAIVAHEHTAEVERALGALVRLVRVELG